ncbi:MAG: ATP-binding cassette domain-containing protein [Acidimicrobiia bacterium]|nr:ATP-binding cassette domain-containing protein [Acidimicrobiia bacterium]
MLQLEGLVKRYGDVVALNGCTLTAAPGRMLGFLGPNGAGKTTAMRSVFGLVALDAGGVSWRGAPIDERTRRTFGYMPEQRGLYPRMKVRDQLVYLAELHGMAVEDAVHSVDRWLEEFGLSERAQDRLEQLSHGNQQRIQLVAALVFDPDLLVLDEPFSGLDPLGVQALGATLKRQAAAGKTVVFSSHQLDLVEDLCEEVAIIHAGKVVLSGDVKAVKERALHRRVEVQVAGSDGSWLPQSSQIVSSSVQGDLVALVVDRGFPIDELLTLAARAGTVTHVSFEAPTLSEVFLEAVAL